MKKFFVASIMALAVMSCTKESKTSESELHTDADSTASASSHTEDAAKPFKKVEWNVAEASKLLGDQKSDTLYVTNFFATWCGPCVRELPHFREKMTELKDQPVKFTFVSIDAKEDWDNLVPKFAAEQGITGNVVLLDGENLSSDFFSSNFKQWDGGSIPFTFMRKGAQTDETIGMMSAETLNEKINSFK